MSPSTALQLDHKSEIPHAYWVSNSSKPAPLYATNTVWRTFQDGMKILYQYAGRSGANSNLIAKANLRLLHDTLLDDPSYRARLAEAENKKPESDSSAACSLFNTPSLCADLITLQPGSNATLSNNGFYDRMYMLIEGKAIINHVINVQEKNNRPLQHKPWWKRFSYTSNNNVYKQRDVVLSGHNDHTEKLISALECRCLLLRISLQSFDHSAGH